MKSFFVKSVFVFSLLLGLFSVSASASEPPLQPDPPEPVCAHRFVYTYTDNNAHTAACSICGETFTEPCSFAETVVFPTQTAAGYTQHSCEKCGYCYKDAVLAAENACKESRLLGDIDGDGAVTANDARAVLRAEISLEPIAADKVPYADMNGDGVLTAQDARIALRRAVKIDESVVRHRYVIKVKKEPGCTAVGSVECRCAYCGDAHTVAAPAKGHRYGEESVTPATCTKTGLSTRVCGVCGYKNSVVLRMIPHVWKASGDTVSCGSCGKKANGWVSAGGEVYYCVKGGKQHSWCEIGGAYYFLDRRTGVLARNGKVDGLTVGADGKAVSDAYTTEKIRTLIKAKNIIAEITLPTDSVDEKKLKAFRWVMKFPYAQYRLVGRSMKTPGFEMLFANDIFDRHSGCCGSTSYAFAFLAVECGCNKVYVADDGVSEGGHAWVTMEGNNNVYDIVFAKAKSFSKNYNYNTSDYRRNAPRKTYIGG